MAPKHANKLLSLVDAKLAMPHPGGLTTADLVLYPSIACQLCLPVRPVVDKEGNPKNEYDARSGKNQLRILSDSRWGVPWGIYPRRILSFVGREIHRTREPLIDLGRTLDAFIRSTGPASTSGGKRGVRTNFQDQLLALAASHIHYLQPGSDPSSFRLQNYSLSSSYAQKKLWGPQFVEAERFERLLEVDPKLFQDILEHGVPLRADVLRALGSSCLSVDIYAWLTYRANSLNGEPLTLRWSDLIEQFGAGYAESSYRMFKSKFKAAYQMVREVYDPADPDCVRLDVHGDKVIITAKRPSVPTTLSIPSRRATSRSGSAAAQLQPSLF